MADDAQWDGAEDGAYAEDGGGAEWGEGGGGGAAAYEGEGEGGVEGGAMTEWGEWDPEGAEGGGGGDDGGHGEWEQVDDGEGGAYYYNLVTGETAWEVPAAAGGDGGGDGGAAAAAAAGQQQPGGGGGAWQQAYDDDGNAYYTNEETGAVQWEVPEEMAGEGGGEAYGDWGGHDDDDDGGAAGQQDGYGYGGGEYGGGEYGVAGGPAPGTGQRRNSFFDACSFDLSAIPPAIVELVEFMCEEVEYGNVGRAARHAKATRRARERAVRKAQERALLGEGGKGGTLESQQLHPEQYYALKRRRRRRLLERHRSSAREKRAHQAGKRAQVAGALRLARERAGAPAVPPRFTDAMLQEIEAVEAEHRWGTRVAAREAGKLRQEHRRLETLIRDREAAAQMQLLKRVMEEITQGKELRGLAREEEEEQATLSGANVQAMTRGQRDAADALRNRVRAAQLQLRVLAGAVFDRTLEREEERRREEERARKLKHESVFGKVRAAVRIGGAAFAAAAAASADERGANAVPAEVRAAVEALVAAVEHEAAAAAHEAAAAAAQQGGGGHHHKHHHKHIEHIEHVHVKSDLHTHDPWADNVPKDELLKTLLEDAAIAAAAKAVPGLAPLLEEPWREKIGARNHYLDAFASLETAAAGAVTKPEWLEYAKVCDGVAAHAKAAREYMARTGLGKESDAKAAWEKKLAEARAKEAGRHYRKSGAYLSDLERLREAFKAEQLCVEIQLSVARKCTLALRKLAAWGAFRRLLRCAQAKQESVPWWRQKHQPLLISVAAHWAPPSIPGGNPSLYNCEARHRVYLQKKMLRDAHEAAWRAHWDGVLAARAGCFQEFAREEERAALAAAAAAAPPPPTAEEVARALLSEVVEAACDAGATRDAPALEQVSAALAAVLDAVCEQELARQAAAAAAASAAAAPAAPDGSAGEYLLALQAVYNPAAAAGEAAGAPQRQGATAATDGGANASAAWDAVRDRGMALARHGEGQQQQQQQQQQQPPRAQTVGALVAASAARNAARAAAAAAQRARAASGGAAQSVAAAARAQLMRLKAALAATAVTAPKPPLAAYAQLRRDLAQKRREREAMRSMSPHERLQVLRLGFLPSGALERHFAVRAEVRRRVGTRQRLRRLSSAGRLEAVKRAAAEQPSAALLARRGFLREVGRLRHARIVRGQVGALLSDMVGEVEEGVRRSAEHLREQVGAVLSDLTASVRAGIMRAAPVFYADDVEAAINDEVWERRLRYVEAEEARERERRQMADEETAGRLEEERAIRFTERLPRLLQEAGRRDFHALQQRCLCPPPLLMRLTWERTLKAGRHDMSCLVKDPSDGSRYIYQAAPCQNPADAAFVLEQAELLKDFRNPFVARVRDVFGFKYQTFNTSGIVCDTWHQVIVLTQYCAGGELLRHIADRQRAPDESEVQQWTLQMVAGLSAMHARDLLHRNINLGNVYLDGKGNVRLASFQFAKLARPVTSLLAHRRCAGGTPSTLAPELERMEGPTTKSDVWALGCVLFRLMTGSEPAQLALRAVADITGQPSLQFGLKLRHVLRMCLHEDKALRADAHQVFGYLSMRAKPPRIDARAVGAGRAAQQQAGSKNQEGDEEERGRGRRVLPPLGSA